MHPKSGIAYEKAAVEAGAPQKIISCISMASMEGTNELMKSDEVKMIIAKGGPGMVKAAYGSGKPALGLGLEIRRQEVIDAFMRHRTYFMSKDEQIQFVPCYLRTGTR